MRLLLVVPDRPRPAPSGGDRYDAALASALRDRGVDVHVARVRGGWPWPTAEERRALADVLGDGEDVVLLDGLVASSSPEETTGCAAARPTAVLLHSRLSAGAGAVGDEAVELDRREARALRAVGTVVVPSRFAADEARSAYGLSDVVVAPPGTCPAPVAPGSAPSGPPALLTLAAVTPSKNHALLLDALALVRDLPWTAVCAGPAPDASHLGALRDRALALGVGDRVTWPGALVDEALETVWRTTNLLVHPSRSESYGMVVAEAHARGIPTVVGRRTGAEEVLRGGDGHGAAGAGGAEPGAAVDTDQPQMLAEALRRWLTEPDLRRRWRDAALRRRAGLPGWDRTAETVEQALARLGAMR